MNYTRTALLVCFVSCLTWAENLRGQTTLNRAPEATVSTSFVSPWEELSAVNDDVSSTSSASKPSEGAYGNWNGESFYNTYNWVQYEWDTRIRLVSTSVYWWSDGGGISQPTDAYIEYWNGVSWVNAGQIGSALDMYNTLNLDAWTNKVRINMKSNTSTGIIEWQVLATDEVPCTSPEITTMVKVNDSPEEALSNIVVGAGDTVIITASVSGEGQLYWFGPDNFSTTDTNSIYLENLKPSQSGTYRIAWINDCGGFSQATINLTVSTSNNGSAYEWPAYEPSIYYDFRDTYPDLEMPTEDLDDCDNVAGRQSSGWWTFVWGPNARSEITEAAITPMLERFNQDFAYFRDTMGWPPDKRAKNGYRSAIYLYGSGLSTDNADTNALGGWQGNIHYQGENWPMVLASYYPVYSFDPDCPYGDRHGQMGAMIHEGIHSVLADMPGARNAAWFHEGGNTWLQQEMESRKSGDYSSMGFLNAGALIAPFMPIECYSGWLQDESFGGPSAEGVNMFNGGQQICTWKNLLGGTQYGNLFPVVFSQIFSDKSVAWIWQYCENRVLEGIADTLGDYQTRRMIMQYRAKQALIDIGQWTGACRNLIDANFGVQIRAEWQPSWLNPPIWNATPYAITSDDGTGLLIPEYRTTPGWSGANQIPLIVEGNKLSVEFLPIDENMSCQLCYRAADGSVVYGEPVLGGECTLNLDKQPANNVVFAVVCNTDYIYEGEQTRTAHFDYRLRLGTGVKERANWNNKWYRWDSSLSNTPLPATTVDFSANATDVNIGSTVNFTDKSKNAVRGWHWDFGDGSTSTERNPNHTYSTNGIYSVTLTLTGINGAVSKTKTDYITVSLLAPAADFSADATSIHAGSTVNFTDLTENNVSSWSWNFGDGNSSSEQNPAHTYTEIGTYSVSLMVSGNGGSDSITKSDFIAVSPETGTYDVAFENKMVIFPNPAKISCTVLLPDGITGITSIKIFDAIGKELFVKTDVYDNSYILDLSDVSAGLYYISLLSDHHLITEKLIRLR